jgi:hypothetical protein
MPRRQPSRSLAPALAVLLLALTLGGCGDASEAPPERSRADRPSVAVDSLFSRLPAAYTNVGFTNELTYTKDLNVFTYRNYHNGGGVAIGDLNGDGRQDLFFTSNQGANRLYLNRGDWWFDDVTAPAGVGGEQAWSTGVTLADVNGDGRLDIYVCNSGNIEGDDRHNELYINQGTGENGVPTFEERAADYGIAGRSYSTHASFFDYDRDGDLDLYLLNNAFTPISDFDLSNNRRNERDALGGDKLYRNDGDGTFTDVTAEAGIYESEIGFGLGVSVGDLNRDGWPDIYVSNDFFERDYLYLNNQDGTFREVLEEKMRHTSLSSMGADIADLTNNGRPDVFVTDMLPDTDRRLKTTSTFRTWRNYQYQLRNGYYHQLMRNTLQLNNGDGTFSEVSHLAGVDATDWSWGALAADFNLDGRKDVFVSNGVYKDVTNQDFLNRFSSRETAEKLMSEGKSAFLDVLERIPSTPLPNALFRNDGDRTFTDRAGAWGLSHPSFSNGSAYGDLDNDGDLDLVVNNLNQESFLYRNEADSLLDNHYLQLELRGEAPNTRGLGTQVTIEAGGRTVYLEQMAARGFQSSVGPVLTAGLGEADTAAAVTVAWPDGRVETRTDVPADRRLVVRQADAGPPPSGRATPGNAVPDTSAREDADAAGAGFRFADATGTAGLDYRHEENEFVDFNRSRLLPKKVSTEGPRAATGDVNGDGRTDVFLGGAKNMEPALYVQTPGGGFRRTDQPALAQDEISEDVGATFFDADGDGDLDLYVVSGGNAFSQASPALQDRLYLNDGTGTFSRDRDRLPDVSSSGSVVAAADYDDDGDTDLFVGGRLVPWRYGKAPTSTLLENDGTGHFSRVTKAQAPGLASAGMVTDAAWADVSGNGRTDLVVVGEWMPLTVYENTGGGRLEPLDAPGLDSTGGWWTRLLVDDFDADGDPDLVVGNLGENTRYRASADEPASLYAGDFNRDGYTEPVLAYYRKGRNTPVPMYDPLVQSIGALKQKFGSHEAYADAAMGDVFSEAQVERATVRHTHTFSTSYVENEGDGSFSVRPLPYRAQVAPMYGLEAGDFNGDGHLDLMMAGNFHGGRPGVLGRIDASYGLVLRGDGTGAFTALPARETGFRVHDQARDLTAVDTDTGRLFLVLKNDAPLQVFRR